MEAVAKAELLPSDHIQTTSHSVLIGPSEIKTDNLNEKIALTSMTKATSKVPEISQVISLQKEAQTSPATETPQKARSITIPQNAINTTETTISDKENTLHLVSPLQSNAKVSDTKKAKNVALVSAVDLELKEEPIKMLQFEGKIALESYWPEPIMAITSQPQVINNEQSMVRDFDTERAVPISPELINLSGPMKAKEIIDQKKSATVTTSEPQLSVQFLKQVKFDQEPKLAAESMYKY
ncbi:hypothetical protein QYM36_012817 [Artemia franciscana]|uniref:Uncharacterized protein n=1 Tax=Artemia franciscana TaxID=6661 RepID=A0AA88HMW5_ARTSF|nr:hypothetical protein QYM36_012817 [Artemia franciscana]